MLLSDEDKRQFPARTAEEMTPDGVLQERLIPGWEMLLRSLKGREESDKLGRAILECIGLSQPIIDQAEALTKKKLTQVTNSKKSRKKSAGAKSVKS